MIIQNIATGEAGGYVLYNCELFVNLMKKSLTKRFWDYSCVYPLLCMI